MELQLKIIENPYEENTGTLSSDVEQAVSELTLEEKNTKLLEQINYKLDLLLSIEEGENHG